MPRKEGYVKNFFRNKTLGLIKSYVVLGGF